MHASRQTMVFALAAMLAGGWSCGAREETPMGSHAQMIGESPAALRRVADLRTRFVLKVTTPPAAPFAVSPQMQVSAEPRAALRAGAASGFEVSGDRVQPVMPIEARQGVTRTATASLPVHAADPVRLEDDTSHVAVSFALRGASHVGLTTAQGIALYPGALAGEDVLHRVHPEGTEDYVVFERRPEKEEIAYDVDVSHAAGLRLVSNTLEFLDDAGAPRLRVAPPYVVDVAGARSEGLLTVEGCSFDVSPAAPWGRPVTSPGASQCGVRVSWSAVVYPAMLDPGWTATGSLVAAREDHSATLLDATTVLLAGGIGGSLGGVLSSAELYDATAGTFAATGSMTTARYDHTATLLSSGNVLVAGGISADYHTGLSGAEIYDPTAGTFTVTGSMATPRRYHTATLLGSDNVLIAGGASACGYTCTSLSSAELYDPMAGTFAATGSLVTARDGQTATLLGSGEVLLVGGESSGGGIWLSELYDPVAGTFAATGMTTAQRLEHTATLLGSGQVLVAGGAGGVASLTAELYDPSAGTFATTGSLLTGRAGPTATLLGTGEVLIAGGGAEVCDAGICTGVVLSTAELYDPSAGGFTATASMTTVRQAYTATLLGAGEVLVAGGLSGSGDFLATAELYCTATPITTCPAGYDCGAIANGCGGKVSCGTCSGGQLCAAHKCVAGGRDAGSDSGAGGKDSGVDARDSGTDAMDSGLFSKDSGAAGADSGPAADGGNPLPGQPVGCSCHAAQRHDVPSLVVFGLGALVVGMRRIRGRDGLGVYGSQRRRP
jgi:hypothetical protein